jgi:3'-5' exoribonuclease
MKSIFVRQLQADTDLFDQPFLLAEVIQRETKDGRSFLLFTLADATGQVSGVFWSVPAHVVESCLPGRVVLVTGKVRLYNGRLQVAAVDLQPYQPDSMADYTTCSQRDRDEMADELRSVVANLREPLDRLVSAVLLEPTFLRRFVDAPAATTMHHAYVGGLLQHVLSMVSIGRLVAGHYPLVDQDLLYAGILLHDVGKVFAYQPSPSFPITDTERLIGHVARGAIVVQNAAAAIDGFPDELLQQLLHLVVSHQGTLEWGSPVLPRTLEAVILHQLDLLDSRVQGFLDHVLAEPGESSWSSRSPMFGIELMRKPSPSNG